MMKSGNVGPTGERLPKPDLLLLSYTGCFTFMKWFEILREEYDCPVAMLHVPYQADGAHHRFDAHVRRRTAARQGHPALGAGLREALRRGRACASMLARSARAEDDLVAVLKSAKQPALADRRVLRRRLLHRPDLQRVPRHRGCRRLLPHAARRDRGARPPGTGSGDAGRTDGARALPPRRRGPAQLDQLPRVLEDVRRRGCGGRGVDLHQGGRRLRHGLPPRSRPPARDASPSTAWAATPT